MSPTPITLIGSTGLTGSFTLSCLLQSTHPFTITTIARKGIPTQSASNSETTHSHVLVDDLFGVPTGEGRVGEKGGVYASCLGTTRRAAGGVEEQEKLDHFLNRDLAKRAKDDGVDTLILVSSAGTSADSSMAYSRMKGQLDEEVKAMNFKSCVILRPAFLLGSRNEFRGPEYLGQNLFRGLRAVGIPGMNQMCVNAEDVGACIAYYAANPPSESVTVVDNLKIIQVAKAFRAANAGATTKQ